MKGLQELPVAFSSQNPVECTLVDLAGNHRNAGGHARTQDGVLGGVFGRIPMIRSKYCLFYHRRKEETGCYVI